MTAALLERVHFYGLSDVVVVGGLGLFETYPASASR